MLICTFWLDVAKQLTSFHQLDCFMLVLHYTKICWWHWLTGSKKLLIMHYLIFQVKIIPKFHKHGLWKFEIYKKWKFVGKVFEDFPVECRRQRRRRQRGLTCHKTFQWKGRSRGHWRRSIVRHSNDVTKGKGPVWPDGGLKKLPKYFQKLPK